MKYRFLSLLIGLLPAFAAADNLTFAYDQDSPQQVFAAQEFIEAMQQLSHKVKVKSTAKAKSKDTLVVRVKEQVDGVLPQGFKLSRSGESLLVEAIDQNGAMYGIMDVAEKALIKGSLDKVSAKLINPRFDFRAVKHNLSWSGYYKHESYTLHSDTQRDLQFWQDFIDMMARNRMNVLSLWNLHPWPYMIRAKNYPQATSLSDEELLEWREFWQALFLYAKNRGIDTYLVNWNIFVPKGFKDYYDDTEVRDDLGLATGSGITSPVIERYTRESVTQTLQEYPNLTGIGVSAGDAMTYLSASDRAQWIERVYVQGIKNAGRPVKFIHRAAFYGKATSTRTTLAKIASDQDSSIEQPVWLELKFNGSHGHSTTKLVKTNGRDTGKAYTSPVSEHYRISWMVRNEDFFALRWGEPDFIRQHIQENGQGYVGGYFVGSETYIPASEYIHKDVPEKNWRWAFQRQWLFYQQWGRLLYNPEEKDHIFANEFDRRYQNNSGTLMTEAFKLVSRMPLRLASIWDSSGDSSLYSEGFLARDIWKNEGVMPKHISGEHPFIDVAELAAQPALDSEYASISEYIKNPDIAQKKISPLVLAKQLDFDAELAIKLTESIKAPEVVQRGEIQDILAWAALSRYFADKLRGTVTWKQGKVTEAQAHLQAALSHWKELVSVTDKRYSAFPLVHMTNHQNNFSWALLLGEVEKDIERVKSQ